MARSLSIKKKFILTLSLLGFCCFVAITVVGLDFSCGVWKNYLL